MDDHRNDSTGFGRILWNEGYIDPRHGRGMQGKGRPTECKDDQVGFTGLGGRHQALGENVINVINVMNVGEWECGGMR
jgi:hypothetical protein